MIGDTISLTVSGTAYTLAKINQDKYSAEYLYKGSTFDLRMQVRNSRDTVKAGQQAFDRHNVTLTRTIYPTVAWPAGIVQQASFTMRMSPTDSVADNVALGLALTAWQTNANLTKVAGWES